LSWGADHLLQSEGEKAANATPYHIGSGRIVRTGRVFVTVAGQGSLPAVFSHPYTFFLLLLQFFFAFFRLFITYYLQKVMPKLENTLFFILSYVLFAPNITAA